MNTKALGCFLVEEMHSPGKQPTHEIYLSNIQSLIITHSLPFTRVWLMNKAKDPAAIHRQFSGPRGAIGAFPGGI